MNTIISDESLATYYWSRVREDVKKVYFVDSEVIEEGVPRNFGVIKMTPKYWEILKVDDHEYSLSERDAFIFSNNIWLKRELTVRS